MVRLLVAGLFGLWLVGLTCLMFLASYTSWKVAILEVVATALLGCVVVAYVKVRFNHKVVPKLLVGGSPGEMLLDGVVLLTAAVLLIVPGLVSDVVGLILLLPPVRRSLIAMLRRRRRAALLDGSIATPLWCNLAATETVTDRDSGDYPTRIVR